jgi:hypothetical protein
VLSFLKKIFYFDSAYNINVFYFAVKVISKISINRDLYTHKKSFTVLKTPNADPKSVKLDTK